MRELRRSKALGGIGCANCPGIAVDVATGSLQMETQGARLKGLGFPVLLLYSYDSQDSYDGMFGYGRGRIGEVGQKVIDLTGGDAYGAVVLHKESGEDVSYDGYGDGVTWLPPAGRNNLLTKNVDDSWTEERTTGSVVEYDSYGLVTSMRDPRGHCHYYEYDTCDNYGNMLRVIDASGRACYFTYDASDRVTALEDWTGHATYFEYDDIYGVLRKVTGPEFCETYFEYDEHKRCIRVTDPEGFSVYYEYDGATSSGKALKETIPGFGTTYFTYDTDVTTVVDPLGNPTYYSHDEGVVTSIKNALFDAEDFAGVNVEVDELDRATYYTYDAYGSVVETVDALWNTTRRAYDSRGNLLLDVDAYGNAAYYSYDSFGSLLSEVDGLGHVTYYQYDSDGLRTSVLNAREYATYYGYDSYGDMTWEKDALGCAAYYEYDAVGNRTAALDRRGNATYFEYDLADRQTKVTNALGKSWEYAYKGTGELTIALAPRGAATYYEYNVFRKAVSQHGPAGTAYYEYDANANLTAQINPRGNPTYYVYDEVGRPVATIDAGDGVTYFEHDKVGNPVAQTDARLATTYFAYDELNRQRCVTDPAGGKTYFEYDELGNLVSTKDTLARATCFKYDVLGRQEAVVDALGHPTYYAYGEVGDLVALTDPLGRATYFHYDALDRQHCVEDALGGLSYFDYDQVGNVTAVKDARGNASYFAYDGTGRRESMTDAAGNSVYFVYDEVGNVTGVKDAHGNASYFAYDLADRRTSQLDAEGSSSYFGYDANSNLTSLVGPRWAETGIQADSATYFTYDKLDPLASVKAPDGGAVKFGYDEVGNRVAETDQRDGTTYYEYDALGRLVKLIDPLGDAAYYEYDAVGNLTKRKDQEARAAEFAYTDRNERSSTVHSDGAKAYYDYDAASRLVDMKDGWGAHYYEYDDLDRLTAHALPGDWGAAYFVHDEVGNLTSVGYPYGTAVAYYAYDEASRLARADSPEDTHTYYEYDQSWNVTKETLGCGVEGEKAYDKANRVTSIRWHDAGAPLAYFEFDRGAGGIIESMRRLVAAASPYYDYDQVVYYEYDRNDRLVTEKSGWGEGAWGYMPWGGEVCYYEYDAAGNRVRQVRSGGTPTHYHHDAANALLECRADEASRFFDYDQTGSLKHISDVGYSGKKVFLCCRFEDTTDGDDGDEADELSGSRSYEAGEFPGTKAIRFSGGAGAHAAYYFPNHIPQQGTVLLRIKADDWDDVAISHIWYLVVTDMCFRLYKAGSVLTLEYATGMMSSDTLEVDVGSFDDELFYDVCVSWDNSDVKLYVNGVLEDSADDAEAYFLDYVGVGAEDGRYYPWNGLIDEMLVFDDVLTADEIADLSARAGGAANTTYFEYNAANLVESLVTPDHTTYFLYDGNLQRYAIVEDGTATYYLWDGLRPLETRNADGTLKARFTHGRTNIEGIGSCVEIYVPSGSKQYYMLMDHRGSAHVLLDESKAVVASRLYNAFGEWVAQTGTWPAEVPFGYQSNWLYLTDLPDGSPLYLSPTRAYHAGVGRFLQRDMVVLGLNRYSYARSNPVRYVDDRGTDVAFLDERGERLEVLFGGYTFEDYLENMRSEFAVEISEQGQIARRRRRIRLPASPYRQLTITGDCSREFVNMIQQSIQRFEQYYRRGLVDRDQFRHERCRDANSKLCVDTEKFAKLLRCMKSKLSNLGVKCHRRGGLADPVTGGRTSYGIAWGPLAASSSAAGGNAQREPTFQKRGPGFLIELWEDAYRGQSDWRAGGNRRSDLVTAFIFHEVSHLCGTIDKEVEKQGFSGFSGLPYARFAWRCIRDNTRRANSGRPSGD